MIRTHERKVANRARSAPTSPKPLSQRELEGLVRQLAERERELEAKIADERHRLQSEWLTQLDGEVGDDVDRAFLKTQVGFERDLIDRCLRQLNEIAAAHDRIANGEIGICSDCAETIEAARLEANPVASRCTDCQERFETIARVMEPVR